MTADWPRPLISAGQLVDRIGDPRLRIADVRWYLGKPGEWRRIYDAGHLPGAVHIDLDTDLAGPRRPDGVGGRHPLPDPGWFANRLSERGIGDGAFVVAYDDVGGWIASRLWWMLDTLGHRDVAVLDGGIAAWQAAEQALSTDQPASASATAMALRDRWSGTIERDDLRDRLGSVVLLDARAGARYRGEVEPVDPYPGHIPTAIQRGTDRNLGPDGRFLPPDQLRAELEPLFGDGEVVTSCGSGTSATHVSLAARLAGLPEPILYVGSYSDWTRSGYPVVVGPEPGRPEDGVRG